MGQPSNGPPPAAVFFCVNVLLDQRERFYSPFKGKISSRFWSVLTISSQLCSPRTAWGTPFTGHLVDLVGTHGSGFRPQSLCASPLVHTAPRRLWNASGAFRPPTFQFWVPPQRPEQLTLY